MYQRNHTGITQVFRRPSGLYTFCKHHHGTAIHITLGTRDSYEAAIMSRSLLMVYYQHSCEPLETVRQMLYSCRKQLQLAALVGYAVPPSLPQTMPVVDRPVRAAAPKPKKNREKRLTLLVILDDYLKSNKNDWREKTLKVNESRCRYFIDFLGNRLITEVSKSDISDFKQHLVGKGFSPNTCNDYFIKASGLFTFACKQRDFITRSPFDGMGFRKVSNITDKRGILRLEHEQALKGFPEHSQNWWLLQLLWFTGCRISEITQLQPADYRVIDGVKCISINDEGNKTLKNDASRRTIPIHESLLKLGVFTDKPTFTYTPDRASQLVSSIYTGVGVTAHSYRYGMSDRLRKLNIPDYVRFELLGHAHKTTTDRIYKSDDAIQLLKSAVDLT